MLTTWVHVVDIISYHYRYYFYYYYFYYYYHYCTRSRHLPSGVGCRCIGARRKHKTKRSRSCSIILGRFSCKSGRIKNDSFSGDNQTCLFNGFWTFYSNYFLVKWCLKPYELLSFWKQNLNVDCIFVFLVDLPSMIQTIHE